MIDEKNGQEAEQLSEFQVIDWIKSQTQQEVLPNVGIGDDGAVIKHDPLVILASDTVLEGTHFTKDTPLNLVGRKALATCISDIAAMGAKPITAVVNLILPKHLATHQVIVLMHGVLDLAKAHEMTICGGDITSWDGPLGVSITITGTAWQTPILRSGAKKGDVIFVSGPLGNSLNSHHHLHFIPKTELVAKILQTLTPTAMIDISDGLIQDLKHILNASSVGCVIQEGQIPLRKGATLEQALRDGEDFELCLCIATNDIDKIKPQWNLVEIGQITEERAIKFDKLNAEIDKTIDLSGYRHF